MKKINNLFAAALAVVMASAFAGCSEKEFAVNPEQENSSNSEITFGNMLPTNGTRASLSSQTGFPVGCSIGVYGFQKTGNDVDTVLNNQEVIHTSADKWTYNPVKYWNIGSTYEFYGIYPYTVSYSFDADTKLYSITDFTVADQTDDQIDVMISQKNTTYPFNLVTLDFNHLLSQVNFYIKVNSGYDFTANLVSSIDLISFDLSGINNKACYQQTGYHQELEQYQDVNGSWTVNQDSTKYDFPEVNTGTLNDNNSQIDLGTDLLLIPQNLEGAKLLVKYRVNFQDGSTMLQDKEFALNTAKGSLSSSTGTVDYVREWKSNYIYNYYLSIDPSKRKNTNIDWNGTDGGGDEVVDPDADLKGPDGNGDYWVEIDTDGDGDPDETYPVVWEDIDGDGKLEGGIDTDGDGHIDNIDGDSDNPDGHGEVTDGDDTNNPDGKDGILVYDPETDTWNQLERDGTGEVGPNDQSDWDTIDWDGTNGGDEVVTQDSRLIVDDNGNYFVIVDTDGDGIVDETYPVVWEDIDGDGKLEGGVDRDGDGHIDNVDGGTDNPDGYSEVTDGNDTYNPGGKDCILVYDADTDTWSQLEKDGTGEVTPHVEPDYEIEFSATITDWVDSYSSNTTI